MAGKGLNELNLATEQLPTQSYDDLPEFGGFVPPPQPGPYRFRLPGLAALQKVWETFDYNNQKDGVQGQRLRAIFDKDAPLTIVNSPGGKVNNDTFQTRIANNERKRGKEGPLASDMDYLLKALGEKARPTTNPAYAQAVLKYPNGEFNAEITWSWFCNDQKNIWAMNAEGKRVEIEGTKGCGRKYYQENKTRDAAQQIHKVAETGEYPLEVGCSCGGLVRAFANLDNFSA